MNARPDPHSGSSRSGSSGSILIFSGILSLLILLPILGACSKMKTVEWTEDVKLSDGQTIVVQRVNEYGRVMDVGAGFQSGWNQQKARIEAQLPMPVNRNIVWEGSSIPLVRDIVKDTAYLVCVASYADHTELRVPWHEHYVAYKLTPAEWQRVPLDTLPTVLQPNFFVSSYRYFLTQEAPSGTHVNIKLKQTMDSDQQIAAPYKKLIFPPKLNFTK